MDGVRGGQNSSYPRDFAYKTKENFYLHVSDMGCTVSGVERKNYERCVWNQEKTKTSDNSEHFSLCGKGHEENSFKNGKRRIDLGTVIILRTIDSERNVVAKKISCSTRNKDNKASSNSSQINKRVALSNDKNKELFGMDRKHEASHLKGTVMLSLLKLKIVVKKYELFRFYQSMGGGVQGYNFLNGKPNLIRGAIFQTKIR